MPHEEVTKRDGGSLKDFFLISTNVWRVIFDQTGCSEQGNVFVSIEYK